MARRAASVGLPKSVPRYSVAVVEEELRISMAPKAACVTTSDVTLNPWKLAGNLLTIFLSCARIHVGLQQLHFQLLRVASVRLEPQGKPSHPEIGGWVKILRRLLVSERPNDAAHLLDLLDTTA